jgi:vacuolar-type H+-ATPase subunit F/Vma7
MDDVGDKTREKIIVLGDSTLVNGFRLAGVTEHYTLEGAEAEQKLAELMGSSSAGVIIVTEKLMEEIDWRLKKKIEAAAKPIVVAVPSMSGPMSQAESLRELVKRALGFDLMKKQ